MATDDVIVRMRLQDELSSRLARVRAETEAMGRSLQDAAGPQHVRNVGLLGGAFDGLSGRLSTLDGHLNRISNVMDGALYSGIKKTTFALGALTAATTVFGITALNQFQRAHAAFNTLTGSVAAGNQLFSQVAQLNVKSPFDMAPLLASSQTLLGFGFNPQQSIQLLRSLSNVASVQQDPNEALTRMALAVGQIKQTGVLRAQDLNQLIQSGFPAYALANQLGGGNARDILKHGGSISADPFLAMISSGTGPLAKYSGAAQAMNLTPAGQWSNIKFTLQQGMANAFAPLGQQFVKMAPQLQSSLGGFIQQIAPALTQFLTGLLNVGQQLLPILQPIMSGLFGGLNTFFKAFAPAAAQLAPIAQQIGASLANLFTALAQPVFVQAMVDLVGLLPTMIDLLVKLVPILGFFVGLLDKALQLGPVSTIVSGLLLALLGYRILSPLITGTAAALDRFAGSLAFVNAEAGGVPLAGKAGRLGKLGTLGKVVGGATGGLMVVDSFRGNETVGKDLEAIGGGAAVGATLGSVIPGAGTLVGAGIGAGVGALDVGIRRLFGHHDQPQVIQHYVQPGAIVVNNPVDGKEVVDTYEKYITGQNQRK